MEQRTRDYYIAYDRFANNKVLLRLRNSSIETPTFIKLKYTDDIALKLDICNYAIYDYILNSTYAHLEDASKVKVMVLASYYYEDQYCSEIVPYEDLDYIVNKSKEMGTEIGHRLKTFSVGAINCDIPQNYASVIEFKDLNPVETIFDSLEEYYKYDEDLLCHLV